MSSHGWWGAVGGGALAQMLVAQGYYVVSFDNRDMGRSTQFPRCPLPGTLMLIMTKFGYRGTTCGYTLHDMAADVYVRVRACIGRACFPPGIRGALSVFQMDEHEGAASTRGGRTPIPPSPWSQPSHRRCRAAGSSRRRCVYFSCLFIFYILFWHVHRWGVGILNYFILLVHRLSLLDALGIDRCHLIGHSMGGMVSQILAADHPDRVMSLTSLSSCTDVQVSLDLGLILTVFIGGTLQDLPTRSGATMNRLGSIRRLVRRWRPVHHRSSRNPRLP